MNYRKTAEKLNMTQPAVTQHIKHLEEYYGCKFFNYVNKKLSKTSKCLEFEKAVRSIVSLSNATTKMLNNREKIVLNIGATKTIGDYTIESLSVNLAVDNRYEFNLIVDNTSRLLERLNNFEIDVLMLEGYIDKNQYGYKKISDEEIVGICSKEHCFAYKEVDLEEIFNEKIILREQGSGTRDIFENFLHEQNHSIKSFQNKSIISSNKLIEKLVEKNIAIAFVYDVVLKENKNLAKFKIKNFKISHEFNYVFLKGINANEIISILEKRI